MRLAPGEKILARSVVVVSPDESHLITDDLYITCVLPPPPPPVRAAPTRLLTCGHCLPRHAKLRVGSVHATSGFDEDGEGEEMGIVRLHPSYARHASNRIGRGADLALRRPPLRLLRRCLHPSMSTTLFNLCRGRRQPGVLLAIIVDTQHVRRANGRGAHPAILFLRAFEGMIATSSQMRLLVWKSRVRRA